MSPLIYFALNELMVFITLIVVFPGVLPPKDRMEAGIMMLVILPFSFVWWIYLALAPFIFLFAWWAGEWSLKDYADEWPWNKLKRTSP